jgi:hypothetical protein
MMGNDSVGNLSTTPTSTFPQIPLCTQPFNKLWETQETNHKGGKDYGLKIKCPQDYG